MYDSIILLLVLNQTSSIPKELSVFRNAFLSRIWHEKRENSNLCLLNFAIFDIEFHRMELKLFQKKQILKSMLACMLKCKNCVHLWDKFPCYRIFFPNIPYVRIRTLERNFENILYAAVSKAVKIPLIYDSNIPSYSTLIAINFRSFL